jgi:hypothetical protein
MAKKIRTSIETGGINGSSLKRIPVKVFSFRISFKKYEILIGRFNEL